MKDVLEWVRSVYSSRSLLWSLMRCFVSFVIFFGVRASVLRFPVPDAQWNPVYSAKSLDQQFGDWGESGRMVYVVTQWTLNLFFPVIIGSLFACLVVQLLPPKCLAFALPAIAAAIGFDWCENTLLSYFAWKGQPVGPPWLVSLSAFLTRVKYWMDSGILLVIIVASLVVAVMRVYARVAQSRGRDKAVWHTCAEIWNRLLDGIAWVVQMRFPLLALAALVVWAPLACFNSGLRPLAANVLLVDNYVQVISLAWINGLAIIFSIAMLRKLYHLNRRVIDSDYRMQKWTIDAYLVAVLMASVTPVIAFHHSHDQLALLPQTELARVFIYGTLGTLMGLAFSFFTVGGLVWVMGQLFGNVAGDENFFPLEDRDQKAWLWKRVLPSEWKMFLYFWILFLCYWFILPRLAASNATLLSISSYVVILTWMLAMILSGMSAVFDRTRIPIVALLILAIVLMRAWSPAENHLPAAPLANSSTFTSAVHSLARAEQRQQKATKPEEAQSITDEVKAAKQALDELAWQAVVNRMTFGRNGDRTDGRRVLTVVTCPGGGIHAAAWSAYVLEQLDRRYSDFSDSIVVISGVSGGSVGTVFFANSRYSTDTLQPMDGRQWLAAAESSLEAIGQAIVFHDLPSSLLLSYSKQPLISGPDRGQGLEDSWRRRLDKVNQNASIDAWGMRAIRGEMPIVVLNAMDAVSGRRVLFGSVPTPRRDSLDGRTGRPWDYRELLVDTKTDLHVATAARSSATFPYVSPFARPAAASKLGETVAIGDGGYSDNEGIVTAIDWLDFIARRSRQERDRSGGELPFDRVLLLRIQPGSDADAPVETTNQHGTIQSQFRWLSGPLEALASMRTASQVERGQLEVDLAMAPSSQAWMDGFSDSAAVVSTPSNTRRLGSAKTRSPSIQARIHQGNVAIQRNVQSQTKLREDLLERQIELLEQVRGMPPAPLDRSTERMVEDNAVDEAAGDQPSMLTCAIPFIAPEPEADVPLNWKLSPRQSTWYPLAWASLLNAVSEPSSSDSQSVNFLALLDSIFQQRVVAPTEPTGTND